MSVRGKRAFMGLELAGVRTSGAQSFSEMREHLPSGTVTFLFTDVEGSTKLLHDLGAEEYSRVLADHRRVLREAFAANQGVEVDTQGDAFFVAFPTAPGALGAAAEASAGLARGPSRVRMGIHTGTPHLGEEGYVGIDVHRAARIAACWPRRAGAGLGLDGRARRPRRAARPGRAPAEGPVRA